MQVAMNMLSRVKVWIKLRLRLLANVQGVSFNMPRCAASLLLCDVPTCFRCSSCARLYRVSPVPSVDEIGSMATTCCLFCGTPLLQQVPGIM